MTKKDYILIAAVVRSEAEQLEGMKHDLTKHEYSGAKNTLRMLSHSLARALHSDNERFDYDKFRAACEVVDV